ncbi:MAG: HU family DNA-binding protein [Muribaculaceae bacterium]
MNRIIALPYLAAEIAEKNGISSNIAESYVQAVIESISDALARGEQVKIKSLGIFTATPDGNVTFIPEAPLAEAVNSPFSAFVPVVLAEGVDIGTASDSDDNSGPESETKVEHEVEHEAEIITEPGVTPDDEQLQTAETVSAQETAEETVTPVTTEADEEATEPAEEAETEEEATSPDEETESVETPIQCEPADNKENPVTIDTPEVTDNYDYSDNYDNSDENDNYGKSNLWLWAVTGLFCGIIIGFVVGYLLQPEVDELITGLSKETVNKIDLPTDSAAADSVDRAAVAMPVPADSVIQAEAPENTVIYDTIRSNRFLTTMARQHYGKMEYWVYIYEANADILGHPDRAKAGTVVKIPDITKYVTSASDSINLAHAQAKAIEIYAPYRR